MMMLKALVIFCCVVLLINLAYAQDQTGFISIDCGLQPVNSSYTEASNGLNYVSDSNYTDTGTSNFVAPEYRRNMMQSMWSIRSFQEGIRNCYTIAVNDSTKYLIRAAFMYGNYDSRNELPEFDLHLGPNKWDTVRLESPMQVVSKEIIHYVLTDTIQVCLVNTGNGTPFISALELRMLPNSSYVAQEESLQLFQRLDYGSTPNLTVRYPDDVYDRIWFPSTPNGTKQVSDPSTSLRNSSSSFRLPQAVMRTAIEPENAGGSLDIGWTANDPSLEFYFYMYFTEVQEPDSNSLQRREFTMLLNGRTISQQPFTLEYLRTLVLSSAKPLTEERFEFSFRQTENSFLPPLINAIETYFANKLPQSSTELNDLSAMRNIKSGYKVKRNWQGDPCVPRAYTWEGLNCSFNGTSIPRVIALNLSFTGLTGEITSEIQRLSQLEVLDLSNNNLTGPIPAFLAQLQFLRVINLANNQLTGPIPPALAEKAKNGMSFILNGNPSICLQSGCEEDQGITQTKSKANKLPSFVIPLVASLAGLFLIVIISAAILFIFMRKKKKGRTINRTVTASSNGPSLQRRDTGSVHPSQQRFAARQSLQRIESGMTDYELNETALVDSSDLEPATRKFTYAEIVNITNGFEKDQGKVGFGRNYLGQLDGKEVTVKLVSSLSSQGYKQLRAEVKHLFRIHHKNLITMLGYCNEGDKMAVIYEYMENGNLKQHISGSTVFSWEDRLGIAIDVAQGLEYLHTGCTPPIIHRNVKCTNVFLDGKFNAKLGGFGLSRAFDAAEGSHLNTAIAGTPGYVDPDYYTSNILTEKSDVYSFGVVLLEIVTAKPAIIKDAERMHISQWVESLLGRENLVEIIDPSLCGDYDPNSAFKTVEIAVACVSRDSGHRPGMSQVVTALKESLAVEVERKNDFRVDSTDSVEDLALGFGSNPPPRLR